MKGFKRGGGKLKHVGRESFKFSFDVRVVEVSGLPQSVISSATGGEVAATLSRGVKVAR